VRLLQELEARKIVTLYNVPGTANPADAMTKHLAKLDYVPYMIRLYNCKPEDLMV
jgi:hypothetical protein